MPRLCRYPSAQRKSSEVVIFRFVNSPGTTRTGAPLVGMMLASTLCERYNVIVGLGSMGKRRVRCLKRLGISEITGFDPRPDRREETNSKYGIDTLDDWDRAKRLPVNAWIISTPPDTHIGYGLQAIDVAPFRHSSH